MLNEGQAEPPTISFVAAEYPGRMGGATGAFALAPPPKIAMQTLTRDRILQRTRPYSVCYAKGVPVLAHNVVSRQVLYTF